MRRGIVPPYLLLRLAEADGHVRAADAARRTLVQDAPFRQVRERERPSGAVSVRAPGTGHEPEPGTGHEPEPGTGAPHRRIHDAEGRQDLPGRLVRSEGDAPTGDRAVTEAYDGLGDTFELLLEAFARDSVDGRGMWLEATVHYGRDYDNAFWDGVRMVFGDGDGEVFRGFTGSLSVIGHELAHGVTERTANLRYQGQSGALNEHISDVIGALVEQFARAQTADTADWLIGEGVFTEQVQGRALRSMIAPGTAYDDDVLGRDPQPDHMRAYISTREDNGGVHLNSGIPNKAFATAAVRLGGHAWERAGLIWYDTLTSGRLPPDAGFTAFAHVTVALAAERFGTGSQEADAVRSGWDEVGVAFR